MIDVTTLKKYHIFKKEKVKYLPKGFFSEEWVTGQIKVDNRFGSHLRIP